MTHTKSTLVKVLRDNLSLQKEESEAIVECLLQFISDLGDDDKIEIRGFGTFSRKKVSTKGKHSPVTGALVVANEYTTLRFKASRALRYLTN